MLSQSVKRYLPIGFLGGVLLFLVPLIANHLINGLDSWRLLNYSSVFFVTIAAILSLSNKEIRLRSTDILVIVYCIYALIRTLFSQTDYTEPLTLLKWISVAALYLIGRLVNKDSINYLTLSLTLCGIVAYIFHMFLNTGHLGSYVSICLTGSICLIFEAKKKKVLRYFSLAVSIVLLIALVISHSRGAVLGAAVGILCYAITSSSYKSLGKPTKIIIIISILLMILIGNFILYSVRPDSANVRLLIWSSSWKAFTEAPFFGYSSGSVQSLYMYWQAAFFESHPLSSLAPFATNHYQSFNEFLHLLCEQGLMGLIFFGLIILSSIKNSRNRCLKSIMIALGVCSCFLYTWDILPIAFLIPLFLGMAVSSQKDSSENALSAYTIHLNKWTTSLVCLIFLTSVSYFSYHIGEQYNRATKELRQFIQIGDNQVIDRFSKETEDIVFKNKNMSLLYATHSYKFSPQDRINVLEQCNKRITVVERLSTLGGFYYDSGDFKKAEDSFITAYYMTPDRIIPKYDLFKFYKNTNNKIKASEWANIIIEASPRLYNAITIEIKYEAREFLSAH